MADVSEKVPEELSKEKQCVKTQMLPPPLPISAMKKEKKLDASKSAEKTIVSAKEEAGGLPTKTSSNVHVDTKSSEFECKETEPSSSSNIEEKESISLPVNNSKEEESVKIDKDTKNGDSESTMLPPKLSSSEKKNDKDEASKKDSVKKDSFPDIQYSEPSWSGIPQDHYYLELLKGGCIISTKHLTSKSYYVFGRLPNCDIVMDHPSISRYHAIIQYKASDSANGKKGFYLYDLGSTHGTKVNKIAIHPKRYYRLQVGYVIKFGGSTRLYILQGPEEMDDNETPEELVKPGSEVGKVMTEAEYEEWKEEKERKPQEEDDSCGWGFGEDAVEEEVANPFASELEEGMEETEFKDPKKTLRGYYEREGLELEYLVDETGPGHARVYNCRVKLPVEDANGDPLFAEAAVTGKKREAVLACAAEACRLLDVNGLLRQSSHESKKKKLKNWEDNDYYDSDEDTFLDRTGSIENKRLKRMKMVKKEKEEIETFESLSSKLHSVEDEIKSLEEQLEKAMKASKAAEESEDSLESYMKNIDKSMDRTSRMQMRRKIFDLKKERQKLSKLVDISRPASLPSLVNANLKSKGSPKETVIKTKASTSSDDATSVTVTTDPHTDTRHEQAEQTHLDTKPNVSTSEDNISKSKIHTHNESNEADSFVKPKMTAPKFKPKAPPPSSSISMLLEGLKESTGTQKKSTKTEKRPRKQQPDNHEEPANKKIAMSPEPVSPTRMVDLDYHSPERNDYDEDYSDWVPPTGQSGDGRTKLNEKYGY